MVPIKHAHSPVYTEPLILPASRAASRPDTSFCAASRTSNRSLLISSRTAPSRRGGGRRCRHALPRERAPSRFTISHAHSIFLVMVVMMSSVCVDTVLDVLGQG